MRLPVPFNLVFDYPELAQLEPHYPHFYHKQASVTAAHKCSESRNHSWRALYIRPITLVMRP